MHIGNFVHFRVHGARFIKMTEEANKIALAPSRMMDNFSKITNRILRQTAVADTQTWLVAALDTPPIQNASKTVIESHISATVQEMEKKHSIKSPLEHMEKTHYKESTVNSYHQWRLLNKHNFSHSISLWSFSVLAPES